MAVSSDEIDRSKNECVHTTKYAQPTLTEGYNAALFAFLTIEKAF